MDVTVGAGLELSRGDSALEDHLLEASDPSTEAGGEWGVSVGMTLNILIVHLRVGLWAPS